MSLFAIFFAVAILVLFWGGFVFMLFYSLKLKKLDRDPSVVSPPEQPPKS
jgi:hypothetical protein